jgi:putative glutamine amidotransferase
VSSAKLKPIVGIPASVRLIEMDCEFHGTALQYLRAVRDDVGATVFTIPGLGDVQNAIECLDMMDGLLLTGSFSNMHPSTYGEEVNTPLGFYDQKRDATTLPLIRAALERGMPVFGICRGMQEINVALGGSLHQVLVEVPGYDNHMPDETKPLAEQFGPAHEIAITPGGVLSKLIPDERIIVSTAHMQCVNRVAPGCTIEAVGDDGMVEAISVDGAKSFAVGVQFHCEWDVNGNALYHALFKTFREACEVRAAARERARMALSA